MSNSHIDLSILFNRSFEEQIDLLTPSDDERQKSKVILERLKKELREIEESE